MVSQYLPPIINMYESEVDKVGDEEASHYSQLIEGHQQPSLPLWGKNQCVSERLH